MKTNRIFHYGFCLLLSIYVLNSKEDDFTTEEKAQAKQSIIESFYKVLPDSVKILPYDSLIKYVDRYTYLIKTDERNRWLNPQKTDRTRLGYSNSGLDKQRIISVLFEGDAYSSGMIKDDCIEHIRNRIPSDKYEWKRIIEADSGTIIHYTLSDEAKSEFTLPLQKNYIDENEIVAFKLGRTAIIRFEDFHRDIHTKFRQASMLLVPETIDTLILDMRDNNGGLVSESDHIASEFMNKKVPLCRFQYRDSASITYSTFERHGIWAHLDKIYVLVNGETASAGEMLSGTLAIVKQAEVVGTTTYGKGVMQSHFPITMDTYMCLTTAEYFPGGTLKVDGIGVIPKRPLRSLEPCQLLSRREILNLRQEYTVPSVEAFQDPRIAGKEYLAEYIWDIRGEMFAILAKGLYK
jgi:carboxyl-terminal processing protease